MSKKERSLYLFIRPQHYVARTESILVFPIIHKLEFCTELRILGKKNPKYDVSFKIMPKVVRMGNWSQLPAL